MGALAILMGCLLVAAPGEAGGSEGGELPPRRDVFGTARGGRQERVRVWGTVDLSDGTRAEGWLSLAPGRPFEVYDLDREEWREFEMHEIAGLRATPRKEELEREWRWKEYGKDEKVYTGRAYPKRWFDHELVVRRHGEDKDAESDEVAERIRCHVRGAVLYLTTQPEGPPADETASDRKRSDREESDREKSDRKRSGEREGGEKKSGGSEAGGSEADGREAHHGKPRKKPRPGRVNDVVRTTRPGRVDDIVRTTRPEEGPRRLRFILRQYVRGKLGQALEDLVYVRRVAVRERASAAKRSEAKRGGAASTPRPDTEPEDGGGSRPPAR